MGDPEPRLRDGAPGVGSALTPDAFALRLQEHRCLLWAIAAGVTGDRDAADDLVQESAAIALNKLNEFDASTSFGAWMSQIVRYTALNHARLTRRRATRPSADPGSGLDAPRPRGLAPITPRGEVLADQGEFDDRVVAALGELDPSARACLLLRTVADLSYKEIALAMDVPEGTAMSHVFRARKRLRDALRDPGGAGRSAGREAANP